MKKFLLCLLCLGSYVFGDVESTREVLKNYCHQNERVLAEFDRASSAWVEYGEGVDRLLLAVEFAAEKHEGQVRKDAEKTPYIVHPIGVSWLLWDVGGVRSTNVLLASLLHDCLEDTSATEEEVEALFGSRVLYTVKELSNDPALTTAENKQRQVDHAPEMSLDGQLVKLADRLYNVRDLDPSPPSWSQEKVDGYYEWARKLLGALKGTNAPLEEALSNYL